MSFSTSSPVYLNDCSICARGFPSIKGFVQGFPYFLLKKKNIYIIVIIKKEQSRCDGICNDLGFPAFHYSFGLDEFQLCFLTISFNPKPGNFPADPITLSCFVLHCLLEFKRFAASFHLCVSSGYLQPSLASLASVKVPTQQINT